jgi:3-hydroxyacyl-[acyl-carrier-protein] dehydratase
MMSTEVIGNKSLDIKEILDILPHRYPFVMVDRILDYEESKYITGIKNVTINEPFFAGHFPGEPVMPGVMILEGMAQIGALLAYKTLGDSLADKLVYFAGIDKVRFRKMVRPGDQIVFRIDCIRMKAKLSKMTAKAYVDDQLAAEAVLMATFG